MSYLLLSTLKRLGRAPMWKILAETGMGYTEFHREMTTLIKDGKVTKHPQDFAPCEYEIKETAK